MAETETIFRVSLDRMSGLYDAFEQDLIDTIKRMRALGMSDEQIYARLSENLNNDLDIFSKFKGALEKEIDTIVGVTAQIESNNVFEGTDEELEWQLDPTVREHCLDCLRNSEAGTKTFNEWMKLGLPGFGNTRCGIHCKCTLGISNEVENDWLQKNAGSAQQE